MEQDFITFLNTRIKERGLTVKRLAEMSGITEKHLELLVSGDWHHLPPAPYLRGYILRLGEILDFDGANWWENFKRQSVIKASGARDKLPQNRFTRISPTKYIVAGVVALLLLSYFGFRASQIFGEPELKVETPADNQAIVNTENFVLSGTIGGGSKVLINGEQITVNADGSWSKPVVLHPNLNTFEIVGQKLLGGKTTVLRQLIYEATSTATSTPALEPTPSPSPKAAR